MSYDEVLAHTVGKAVFSNDGQSVGRVKDYRACCIQIDAPFQPDFWLPRDIIHGVSTIVSLKIEHDELPKYKLDEPVAVIA